jgi:hypothetical protein
LVYLVKAQAQLEKAPSHEKAQTLKYKAQARPKPEVLIPGTALIKHGIHAITNFFVDKMFFT